MIVSLWIVFGLQFLGMVVTFFQVDKPRTPITQGNAVFGGAVSIFVMLTVLAAIRSLA
jgi:hypothetical protein